MELALLSLFWLFSAAAVLLSHTMISLGEKHVPDVFKAAYMFGKQKVLNKIESKTLLPIPKRWYTHFYAFGLAVHSLVLIFLCLHLADNTYFLTGKEDFWKILHYPSTSVKERNGWSVVIVFVAEWIQMARRLYECLFISSFSKSTMSPIHYFYGTFLYASFGLGFLASVDFSNLTFNSVNNDAIYYVPAVLMFLSASYYQHKTFHTFASLRTLEKGKTSKGHFIPKGHLFQWVSCPHYLCEMVIYISLCLVFSMKSTYLNSVLAFVVVNQISSSLMTHDWYRRSFSKYPKDRKAVLPYIL